MLMAPARGCPQDPTRSDAVRALHHLRTTFASKPGANVSETLNFIGRCLCAYSRTVHGGAVLRREP